MNNFKRSKIRTKPPLAPLSYKTKQNLVTVGAILLILLGIYYTGVQIMNHVKGSQIFGAFSGVFGKDLIVDSDNHTNILIMGVGGEGHEGRDLTDTLIVASLDHTNHRVSMLSIPRDLYTESTLGGGRVNRLYSEGKIKWDAPQGLDYSRATIEKMLQISIPYVVKIDFQAFEEAVDSLGGVDVYVDEPINDPFYPKGETFEYETFVMSAGMQHLDGATALKYARSRKTSSDFDRSKRQQTLLVALKNKAASQSIFDKQQFLKELYYSLRDHVETNLTIREMLSLASFASSWDSKNLMSATLNDNPEAKGGFLYTPLRELYGGAYVLLPAGDSFNLVHTFVQYIFYGPSNLSKVKIAILNGTKENGYAGKAAVILSRFGGNVYKTANASSQAVQNTVWYVRSADEKAVATEFTKLIPGMVVDKIPDSYAQNPALTDAGIILEMGADVKPILRQLDIFRGVVTNDSALPAPTPATATVPSPATTPTPTTAPTSKPTH